MILPPSPEFTLKGKYALVAGASSGIGVACASALARAGAKTLLVARRQDKLQAVVTALQDEGLDISAEVLDVAEISQIKTLVDRHDPFDIMVNSAGMARHGTAISTTEGDFDAVSGLNFKGAYFLTSLIAQKLIAAKKSGSLINISSQMGHIGGIERALYCGTKHAVEGFTKAMAIEWGPYGIRVNTIAPTFIATELTKSTLENPERRAWVESKIKLGRLGETQDIMGAVLYLASPASALVTGTSLLVDGGWTAG